MLMKKHQGLSDDADGNVPLFLRGQKQNVNDVACKFSRGAAPPTASSTAHSARRVRDGADAAATELMLRAALLRRSCDGVAAATESLLRGSRCCDGDAQTSSVALILRVASRRDALNEEPASFPRGSIQISMVVAHSPMYLYSVGHYPNTQLFLIPAPNFF